MGLTIGVLIGITGGGVFAQLPAQEDIVAQYQNSVSSDNKQWIDISISGIPQNNIWVTGYVGAWDGSAYGTMNALGNESGGTLEADFTYDGSLLGHHFISGGSINPNRCYLGLKDGKIAAGIGAQNYNTIQGVTDLISGIRYRTKVTWNGSTVVLSLATGSGDYSTEYSGDQSGIPINTGTSYFASFDTSQDINTSALSWVKMYDSSDVLVNHWVCESSSTSLQDTIYDIVGGNHVTLIPATTLPFFTTEMEGSKLFTDGFDNVGGSTGLVPSRADGLSATGQQLTNQPVEFIDAYCLFSAPDTTEFYDASVIAGIDTDLYLAGEPIGLTADAWILLVSNPLFFGAVKNILVMYNDTQSGDTLDQINDYLGI